MAVTVSGSSAADLTQAANASDLTRDCNTPTTVERQFDGLWLSLTDSSRMVTTR